MKKIVLILSVIILGLTQTGCSSDSATPNANNSHGLMVNNIPFVLTANTENSLYNTTQFYQGSAINGTPNVRNFILVSIEEGANNMKTLTLSINYPRTQTSINGTYPLTQELTPSPGAVINTSFYMDADGSFGGHDGSNSGSVTITDLGGNNFKLVFNDVVLKNSTSTTKTITGYCQTYFAFVP